VQKSAQTAPAQAVHYRSSFQRTLSQAASGWEASNSVSPPVPAFPERDLQC
jgi:hypothetical protein